MNKFGTNNKYKEEEILKLNKRIIKISKILKLNLRNIKIMKILQIPFEKYETHKIH